MWQLKTQVFLKILLRFVDKFQRMGMFFVNNNKVKLIEKEQIKLFHTRLAVLYRNSCCNVYGVDTYKFASPKGKVNFLIRKTYPIPQLFQIAI